MTPSEVLPANPHQKRPRVNYALAATLLASGMTYSEIAPKVGAKSGDVVKVGLFKKGVSAKTAQAPPQCNRVSMSLVAKVASEASEVLRKDLAQELAATTTKLRTVRMGSSLKTLRQRAEVLEPLARTAKIVHDWGNDQPIGLVALGTVEQIDQAQDAIDVSSGGSDTTIAGVPVPEPEPGTTQG